MTFLFHGSTVMSGKVRMMGQNLLDLSCCSVVLHVNSKSCKMWDAFDSFAEQLFSLYGDDAMSRQNMFFFYERKWFCEFKLGRINVYVKKGVGGHHFMMKPFKNLKEKICLDWRFNFQWTMPRSVKNCSLFISYWKSRLSETMHTLGVKNADRRHSQEKSNDCSTSIPCALQSWKWRCIVAGDETWISYHMPENKWQCNNFTHIHHQLKNSNHHH